VHVEAFQAVSRMVVASSYTTKDNGFRTGVRGLDIGGADVNGSARSLIPYVDRWIGLDIAPGPGVDVVADATDGVCLRAALGSADQFDVVLCTEVLEHVADWRKIVENIWWVLAPGGFAFITAAGCGPGWGRRPHGARGELDPPEGEYYGNVNAEHLAAWLEDIGVRFDGTFGVTSRPNPGDVYAWIRKD
jgi:SAM-dependent methyltransferase